MNKFSKTLLITFMGFFSINPNYAFDVFSLESDNTNNLLKVYGVDLITEEKTLLTEKNLGGAAPSSAGRNSYVNPNSGELVIITDESSQEAYNWQTNSWRTIDEALFPDAPHILQIPSAKGDSSTRVNDSNGVISIGENSLKLKETDTTQEMWATNSSGSIAPINIKNGTDLQINGVSVQAQIDNNNSNISTNTSNISSNTSNIKNLGEGVAGSTALTAALTALPQTSKESKLICGVGSGAYSRRYAVGFGCASKVNERIDINAGGSYVFGGSKSYGEGTLDSGVVKAGFVFKLGELNKPTQISFNDKIIDKKLSTLEENNKNLNAELKLSKAKNDEIISQNQKLLARLDKLENIALKFQSSLEMISVATKD